MGYYIELVCSIFVFIIGTLFGSFFTLATYRIPRKQDIVKTRSYCPNCKHRLGFFDCFPILSYVSTLGRCKYCKKPISIRYPLIEFISGMTFLLIFLVFGFSWQFFALIACYIYMFLMVGVDVMSSKMTDEEKKEVASKKKPKKAGAINVDIILAIFIFVIFFVSTIFVSRNYTSTLVEYARKSEAMNICINNINEAKFKNISELESTSGTTNLDGIDYTYSVQVLPYMNNGTILQNNAKVIISNVKYNVGGKENTVTLKFLKVENI